MRRTIPRKLVLLQMRDRQHYSVEDISVLLYDSDRPRFVWQAGSILSRMADHGAVKYVKTQGTWKITSFGRSLV